MKQRLFRTKDARVTVRMMLGSINWFLRWYRAGGRLTVDEIADAYLDFIFYGLLAPPVAAVAAPPSPPQAAARVLSGPGASAKRRTPKPVSPRKAPR